MNTLSTQFLLLVLLAVSIEGCNQIGSSERDFSNQKARAETSPPPAPLPVATPGPLPTARALSAPSAQISYKDPKSGDQVVQQIALVRGVGNQLISTEALNLAKPAPDHISVRLLLSKEFALPSLAAMSAYMSTPGYPHIPLIWGSEVPTVEVEGEVQSITCEILGLSFQLSSNDPVTTGEVEIVLVNSDIYDSPLDLKLSIVASK